MLKLPNKISSRHSKNRKRQKHDILETGMSAIFTTQDIVMFFIGLVGLMGVRLAL